MPRYFLHIKSDKDFVEDMEGVDLPGEVEAREEAIDAAREILAERVRKRRGRRRTTFDVCDEAGTRLFNLPFRDVLNLE